MKFKKYLFCLIISLFFIYLTLIQPQIISIKIIIIKLNMAFVSISDASDIMQDEGQGQQVSILKYISQFYGHLQIQEGLDQKSLSYIIRYFQGLASKERYRKRKEMQKMVKIEKQKPIFINDYLKQFKLEDNSIQQQKEQDRSANPFLKYQKQNWSNNQHQPYSHSHKDQGSFTKFNGYDETPNTIQKSFHKMEEQVISKDDIFYQQIEEKTKKRKRGPKPKVKESSLDEEWTEEKKVKSKQKSKLFEPRKQSEIKTKAKSEKKLKQNPQSTMENLEGKKIKQKKVKQKKVNKRTSKEKKQQKKQQKKEQNSVQTPQNNKLIKPRVLIHRRMSEKGVWTMDPCISKLSQYFKEFKARKQKIMQIMHNVIHPTMITPFEYFLKMLKRLTKFNLFPTLKFVTIHFELQKQESLYEIKDLLDFILNQVRINGIKNSKIFEDKFNFLTEIRGYKKNQIEAIKIQEGKTQDEVGQLYEEAENKIQKLMQVINKGKLNQNKFENLINNKQKLSQMQISHYFVEIQQNNHH